jgi:hypothetical protein
MAVDREIWLFTRGEESIWIRKTGAALTLAVKGPGHRDDYYGFPACEALDSFVRAFFARLEHDGWALCAIAERRRNRRTVPDDMQRRRASLPPVGLPFPASRLV